MKFLNSVYLKDVSKLGLDTTNTVATVSSGEMVWNQADGTLNLGLYNGVTLQQGQEIHVYGKASGVIANGDVVQFAGAQGDHILIKKAVGSEIKVNPHLIVGIATQAFTNNEYGYVTWFGKVHDLNTNTYAPGTILYFDCATSTLINTVPVAPNPTITICAVLNQHQNQGSILVRPEWGYRIDQLNDVHINDIQDGDLLVWNSTNGRWENKVSTSIENFIDLLDVPNSYLGQAQKLVSVNATEDGLEFIPNVGYSTTILVEEFTSEENQTEFILTEGTYQLNRNRLNVYIWGVRQYNNAFEETDIDRFTLTSTVPTGTKIIAEYYIADPVLKGDKGDQPEHQWNDTSLRFQNPDGTWGDYTNLQGPSTVIYREEFTATEGQTLFTLTEGEYALNDNRLNIYIWGVRQFDNAFVESSTTTFELSAGVPEGTKIIAEYFVSDPVWKGEPGTTVASEIDVVDEDNYFNATTVESIFREIGLYMTESMSYLGSVSTSSNLPEDPKVGHVYYVADVTTTYVWTGSIWLAIGGGEMDADNVRVSDALNYFTSSNVEDVLSEIGYALDNLSTSASDITLTDTADYFTGTDVETALAEVGYTLSNLSADAADISVLDTADYYISSNVEDVLAEVGETLDTVIFSGDSLITDPINIFSAVDEDILPSEDITYDLGSATKRWKDLYLSSNSIHLGDTKLSIESGAFTVSDSSGDPIPVDAATLNGYTSDDFAKPIDITNAISSLVDAAPTALDTLNELAAALGDDANYASTVTNALAAKAPLADPTFTGTVSGVSAAMVGLGNVNNTSDLNKPISSATQTALDSKLNLSGGTLTGGLNGTNVILSGELTTSRIKTYGNEINEYATDANTSLWINYRGYNGGTTQFRDLTIADGKNSQIAKFTGSDKSTTLYGILKVPSQPAFDVAYMGGGYGTANPVMFNTVYLNTGSNYNASTGRFTAPVSGRYVFYTSFIKNGANGAVSRRRFLVNNSIILNSRHLRIDESGSYGDGYVAWVISLNTNDYVTVDHYDGTSYGTLEYDYFGGYLLG